MKRRLFLCGAGNPEGVRLAIRVNERDHRWTEILLLDDDPARLGQQQLGISLSGPFECLTEADPNESEVVNLIARTTQRRRDARIRIAAYGIPWASLVSTDVDLLGASVGGDLIAYQHSTIGPEAHVGDGAVVFMGATVGHECNVGDHCIIAANAVLNARVRLGEGVYVGSHAVVLPEIEIGANAVIGAGAVVIDNVPAGATVVGGIGDVVRRSADAVHGSAPVDIGATLHRIWCEVLGADHIPQTRNFFDAGGTSLMALQLAQRIEGATGLPVCVVDLFHYPTLMELSAHLGGDAASRGQPALAEAQRRAGLRRGLRDRQPRHTPPARG
jgi:sugar O-acyltransferase (sialic acid O-acetyltransferase NeuD family)